MVRLKEKETFELAIKYLEQAANGLLSVLHNTAQVDYHIQPIYDHIARLRGRIADIEIATRRSDGKTPI